MTNMRQTANGGLPRLSQKTPDAHGETPTLSEMNFAPAAFNLNQSSAVCLPLVSDSQKLIWVNSNQINLQMDGAAELDKAFDRFPYLTQKQTAELAQRCSLHPDQVKVWFMAQRLRYGISWDYKDISKIQRKFKSSRGKDEPQNRMRKEVKEDRREKKKQKREVMEEDVQANEQLERKMTQPMKQEKNREVEEDKKKKRKRTTVMDKMGKKRIKQQEDGVMEGAGEITSHKVEKQWQTSTQSELMVFTREKRKAKANKRLLSIYEVPAHKSYMVRDETLDASPLAFDVPPLTRVFPSSSPNVSVTPVEMEEMEARPEGELHVESTDNDGALSDKFKLKELRMNNNPAVADGSTRRLTHSQDPPKKQQDLIESDALPTRIRCRTKTQSQLAMLKVAFSHCQYPNSKDYDWLAMLIGIPRYVLVQWFGDMRYYIKRAKPGWLNEEQYSQALANIKYRQFLKVLEKSSEGDLKP